MPPNPGARENLPGILLCIFLAAMAAAGEWLEAAVLGYRYVDGLVLAIALGTLVHTTFGLAPRFRPGVALSAKFILELAIVLLGGTISAATIIGSGLPLVAAIIGVVILALGLSYLIGRLVGLDSRMATLVACGNSICGNSAIMATAPVIAARSEDVAASIGFTAVLGIMVVLILPSCFALLGLSEWQYGVVAGLSVYAVPQVLAATAPVGMVSAQIGTLVKLVRVLMLGPVILALGLLNGRQREHKLGLGTLIPWFILGFVCMMIARTAGLFPGQWEQVFATGSSLLTLVAMAALGLSVDLRSVLSSGGRVLLAGSLSIMLLVSLALLTALSLPQA